MTRDQQLYFPSRKSYWGFLRSEKIHRTLARFEPANFRSNGESDNHRTTGWTKWLLDPSSGKCASPQHAICEALFGKKKTFQCWNITVRFVSPPENHVYTQRNQVWIRGCSKSKTNGAQKHDPLLTLVMVRLTAVHEWNSVMVEGSTHVNAPPSFSSSKWLIMTSKFSSVSLLSHIVVWEIGKDAFCGRPYFALYINFSLYTMKTFTRLELG